MADGIINCLDAKFGERFAIYHGDCVDVMRQMPDESIDFSVYSPPFGSLFVYSDSIADMGNSSSDGEFAEHYGYEVREKFRLTKPGRLTAVHCSDLPMTKWKDGAMDGLRYFRWVADEAESVRLCAEGARVCDGSLETHHSQHAILHEITEEQYRADRAQSGAA